MDGRNPILPSPPPEESSGSDPLQVFEPGSVRLALDRVLASQEFRGSKRCQEFLKYVVESTLSGQSETLKERTIAMDVFGRGSEYDPGDNATVRVRAGEVRRRLERYYGNDGQQDPIRIDLRAGSYVPEFQSQIVANSAAATTESAASATKNPRLSSLRSAVVFAALVAIVSVAAILLWRKGHLQSNVLEGFWAPVADTASPVLLFASSTPVYSLNHDPLSKVAPRADEFVLVNDQYMGVSDVQSIYKISALLSEMRWPYRVRVGRDLSFDELRGEPAVLVGYTYTHWKEVSAGLRYFIHVDGPPFGILDHGAVTPWVLSTLPNDPRLSEDYAIISRVFHPDTHAMMVELAGISRYGTEAATDLVSNPDLLRDALRGAPPDWRSKNLQIIIHVKIIDGSPSAPQVVTSYFW